MCVSSIPGALFYSQQLHVEGQPSVRWDDTRMATATVSVVRRAHQPGTLADRHLGDTRIPALDHLTSADGELERLAAGTRRIEHRTIVERSGVVNDRSLTRFRVGHFITFFNRDNLDTHLGFLCFLPSYGGFGDEKLAGKEVAPFTRERKLRLQTAAGTCVQTLLF